MNITINTILTSQKSSINNSNQISSQEIGACIERFRFTMPTSCFKLPQDQAILDSYYKLLIYVLNNYYSKANEQNNFIAHNLGMSPNDSTEFLINQALINWDSTTGPFTLEFLLRGIEMIFSYGKFNISKVEFYQIESLLNRLNCLILNNYLFYV